MKKLLTVLSILICVLSYAQVTPIITNGPPYPNGIQTVGNKLNVVQAQGGFNGRIINWQYVDTTAANLDYIKNYPGAQIFTTSDNIFRVRNATATAWIKVSSDMAYPGSGIAVSNGNAWGTSITDNSANWNTAFGWGNHAGLYPLLAGSYDNPAWLNTLGWNKITGAPSFISTASPPLYISGNNIYADTSKSDGKLATFSDMFKKWSKLGDAGTDPIIHYIGASDTLTKVKSFGRNVFTLDKYKTKHNADTTIFVNKETSNTIRSWVYKTSNNAMQGGWATVYGDYSDAIDIWDAMSGGRSNTVTGYGSTNGTLTLAVEARNYLTKRDTTFLTLRTAVGIAWQNDNYELRIGSDAGQETLPVRMKIRDNFLNTTTGWYNLINGSLAVYSFALTSDLASRVNRFQFIYEPNKMLVGINVNNPQANLHVRGTIKYEHDTEAEGKILASIGGQLQYITNTPVQPIVYPGIGLAKSTGTAWDASIVDNSINWNIAHGWGNHAGLYPSLLGSYTNPTWINTLGWNKITGAPSFLTAETDPVYSASSWFGTTNNATNWNTAFGWGNHTGLYPLLAGSYTNPAWITSLPYSKITGAPSFLTAETDPVYSASSWFSTTNNATNWNTAFGWGNHTGLYPSLLGSYANPGWITTLGWNKITGAPSFLTAETDPVYSASSWFGTTNNATNWNAAFGWGNHAGLYPSLLGSYVNPAWITSLPYSKITGTPAFLTTETDPVYSASSWFGTANNSANWNTAFGWGNHASAGYAPIASPSFTGNVNVAGNLILPELSAVKVGTPDVANTNGVNLSPTELRWRTSANYNYGFKTTNSYDITSWNFNSNAEANFRADRFIGNLLYSPAGYKVAEIQSGTLKLGDYTQNYYTTPLTVEGNPNAVTFPLVTMYSGVTERFNIGQSGLIKAQNLSGTGTRMVVANNVGELSTQTISSGGVTDHTLLTNIGTNTHAQIDAHVNNVTTNPHGVTATQVGLGSVNNTSDASKPISTLQQAALDLKAPIASPTFTGTVGGITAAMVSAPSLTTANSYTAGMKQTFAGDATNAGIRFSGGLTANPSTLVTGDLWFRADELKFRYYDGITARAFVTEALTQTLTNKTLTSPVITTPTGIVKGDVGLPLVDNTSDASKPVSTLQQAALDLKANKANPFLVLTDAVTTNWAYTSGINSAWTIAGNRTLAITADNDGDIGLVAVTQDVTGGRLITFPVGDITTAVNQVTTANSTTLYSYVKKGSIRYWNGGGYVETDPVVKAINGIVKSNGTTIAAAIAADFPVLNQPTTGTATSAINLTGGTVGSIHYQTGAGTTGILAPGTVSQTLQSNGAAAPSWVTVVLAAGTEVRTKSAALQSSTIVTEVLVTGLSFAVVAGKDYEIKIDGMYQTAAITTGGELGLFLSGGGVGTILSGAFRGAVVSTAASSELTQGVTAIGAADLAGSNLITTGVTAINSPHYIGGTVIFSCTTSGTINVGWASEVAASAAQLNAGAYLTYKTLN